MNEIKFDEGFEKLEQIVKMLEDTKTPLERSFELYKEAMDLTKYLKKKIDKMENEMKVIIENGNDKE